MKSLLKLSITLSLLAILSVNSLNANPKKNIILKKSNKPATTQMQGIDFSKAAEHTIHAVVHIQCEYSQQTMFYDDFFSFFGPQMRSRKYQTSGSGVIVTNDGYIITNNHVVQDADSIEVILNDKRTYKAKLVGNDPSVDLAVLKIEEEKLPIIEFGDSDKAKIGQWVLAVGNPFNLTSTVTTGIVSAKARNINILGRKMYENPIDFFIQTDAAVNSGNSGGALVNLDGELIGINTAIASNTGSYAGYSFAIPSNVVKKVAEDLINFGYTQKAYIGATIGEIDANFAEKKGIKNIKGVYVNSVAEKGAASKAGIREGDIILKLNNKEANSPAELNEILTQYSPGETITITIDHQNNVSDKKLTLLNEEGGTTLVTLEVKDLVESIGAYFRELTEKEKNEYKINNGVVIEKLGRSPLLMLGLKKGFVITSIDKNKDFTMEDIKALNDRRGNLTIEGVYPNDGRSYYFVLTL